MFLHERIQQKLDEKNLKQADLARATGKSSAAVTKWLRGENVPKTEALKQIAKLLNVDDGWLLTGKGSPNTPPHLTPVTTWDDSTPLDEDEVEIPFFKDFSFACGSGAINEHIANEKRKLRMSKATLRNLSISKENAVAATASGDSMSPTIQDGDTIHIDLGRTEIKDGRIFVICIGGLHYAKRLYNMPFGGVRIVSDNSAEFPEQVLTATERVEQDFQIYGWVWQIARIEKW
ncbi:XRE family transcriptional regulator [Acinetobacter johnsonii]|uniref:XRE family transcriptional regulator n=1 Tax=Acinetobacter johnsonii TaxID=40214 RepID=UPI003AF9BD7C